MFFFQTLTPLLFPAPLFVAYFDCADREDDCDYEEEDSPDEASRHSLPLGVLRNVVLVLLTAKNTAVVTQCSLISLACPSVHSRFNGHQEIYV